MKRLWLAALLVFSGCVRCTMMLATGTLSFVLPDTEATELTAAPSTIQTCIDRECWTDELDETGAGSITTFDAQSRTLSITRLQRSSDGTSGNVAARADSDVSLTISRDGGTVFTRTWTDARFVETEPNGQGCGVYYQLQSPLSF